MRQRPHTPQRLTAADREKILAAYDKSGLTQKEFAAQAGIGYSTLTSWLQKAAAPTRDCADATFVPLPNLLAGASAEGQYRLQFPGGVILEVPPRFHPDELSTLLQLVHAL